MRIAVIGLGKLGSPLAAVLAAKGNQVTGFDTNPAVVEALLAGRAPFAEPGLQEMIDVSNGRLHATTDICEAVGSADASYLIVPTPSGADGRFDNSILAAALHRIGTVLASSTRYHVVNIVSTVMPGSCTGELRHVLEQAAGRTVGDDLGLCYSPEFIALGSVVHDMLNPDVVLIGASDDRAGDLVAAVAAGAVDNSPAVRRMTLTNAELVKISINTYVTTKISFANMLAEICDRLPGADVDIVTAAMGHDSRIGAKYLRGATGYGGPCFPRDAIAFAKLAQSLGVEATLAEATHTVNQRQAGRLVELLTPHLLPGDIVAVLGLAYKPGTPVVEQSQGVALCAALHRAGFGVHGHDPLAVPGARATLEADIELTDDLAAAMSGARVAVVMTPHSQYQVLTPSPEMDMLLDCWGFSRVDSSTVSVLRPGRCAELTQPRPEIGAPETSASALNAEATPDLRPRGANIAQNPMVNA